MNIKQERAAWHLLRDRVSEGERWRVIESYVQLLTVYFECVCAQNTLSTQGVLLS